MKKKELKECAKEEGIKGYPKMSKAELLELWEESQPEVPRKIYYSLHKQPSPPAPDFIINEKVKFEAPILKPEIIKIKNKKFQKS